MTNAAPKHFQEGNDTEASTSKTLAASTESTENGVNDENSSLQAPDAPRMMAVIPTAHPRTDPTLLGIENSPSTRNSCATQDSLEARNNSTAAATAGTSSASDHHVAATASAFLSYHPSSDHKLKEHDFPDTLSIKVGFEPSTGSTDDTTIDKHKHPSTLASSESDQEVMCKPEPESEAPPKSDGKKNLMIASSTEVAKKPAHEDSSIAQPPPLAMEVDNDAAEAKESATLKTEEGSKQEEPSKPGRKKRILPTRPGQAQGRWTQEEHQAFLEGLKVYGREWKKVAGRIPTRTSAQIRSHAQKYFAKLAREESLVLQEQAPMPHNPVPRDPSAALPPPVLPPSAQRNVERILADPTGAQQEVEDTLRALRERYQQLQIRLQERNRARAALGMGGGLGGSNLVEDDESSVQEEQQQHRREVRHQSDLEQRKRAFADLSTRQHHQQQHDDMSSISSNTLSPSLSSLSPSRELGDQELIAIHVLGGTLAHSASNQDLRNLADEAADQANSSTSSVASARDTQDDTTCTSENKRRRLSGEYKSDTDDSAPDDGMVL